MMPGDTGHQAVPGLSIRKMAGPLGKEKSQVGRLKLLGMPMSSVEAARAWCDANLDLSRTADGRIDKIQPPTRKPNNPPPAQAELAPRAAADLSSAAASSSDGQPPGEDPVEPAEPTDEHALAYRQDRARNERIKADRAEIELQQMRGQVVAVADMERLQFTEARIVRDAMEMLTPRHAAELRAVVLALIPDEHRAAVAAGFELHTYEALHATYVREALADASRRIVEDNRDDDAPD